MVVAISIHHGSMSELSWSVAEATSEKERHSSMLRPEMFAQRHRPRNHYADLREPILIRSHSVASSFAENEG